MTENNAGRIKMAKNIMLMFISLVNVDYDTKEVNRAEYDGIGETRTTNESAVRYVLKSTENQLDKIFAFASNGVLKDFVKAADVPENTTHYQYFKNRLKILGLDVENLLTAESVYSYDENKNSETINNQAVWQAMSQILEMAARIQSYVKKVREENPTEKIILHVDCTGGFRNAAMMIMAIMRLMQYQNITIGKVLYSNYNRGTKSGTVEEVNEIYHLFDLISGAEEFVRFGSVDVIKSYFEDRPVPDVLKKLLNAMNTFADAIKISRRSEFQEALEGLQKAYTEFCNAEITETVDAVQLLNYHLVQQLKDRISVEYAELLKNDSDDYVSIINWCLDHGYLQQALTLYTECFPYLILTKDKVIEINENLKATVIEKAEKDKMKREWEYFFLNEYTPEGKNEIFNVYKNFISRLKIIIQSIRKNEFNIDDVEKENWTGKGIIKADYDDYLKLLQELQELKSNPDLAADLNTVAKNLPTLYSFWDLISEDVFQMPVNGRENIILKILENTGNDDFPKKSNNTLITKHMIMHGDFTLNIDEETFLKIIERYFIVKVERNNIAHARLTLNEKSDVSDSEKSHTVSLKEYMKQGLEEYDMACKCMKHKENHG